MRNTGLNKIRHFFVYIRNCYAFSREVDVRSECLILSNEAVDADPSRVGGTENPILKGTNLTTLMDGPISSGGNAASFDDSAVFENSQKVMSIV